MKYFELFDDLELPGRWHLGDVRMADGAEVPLLRGERLNLAGTLSLDVSVEGRPLEFCLTSFAGPIAAMRQARAIADVAGSDVEVLPVRVGTRDGYAALNATRVIRCVDETRSRFTKWTSDDHRADLAGQYRSVGPSWYIDQLSVPPDAHIFRIDGWRVTLAISEAVKNAMEAVGCLGAKFIEIKC